MVVGAILVLAAITIKVGLHDSATDSETPQTAQGENAHSQTTADELKKQGDENTMTSSANSQAHGSLVHATDADFQQKVLQAPGRVLVDFYADWCGPCRMVAPVLEEIAREDPGAKIVKVNVDHSGQVAAQYGIESIPALLVFQDGRVVDQHVGVASKAKLRSMLGL